MKLPKTVFVLLVTLLSLCASHLSWAAPAAGKVNPTDSSRAVEIGNQRVRFSISGNSGAIIEGWNVVAGQRYFAECKDRYFLENEKETVKADDADDLVVAVKDISSRNRKKLVFSCENSVLKAKGISLKKIYSLGNGDNKLLQEVIFTNSGKEGYFIRWYTRTGLDSNFRNGKGNDPRKGPIYYYVPWGPPFGLTNEITEDRLIHAYYPNFQFHMTSVVNVREGYGAGNYLYRVNGRFSNPISTSDEYGDNLLHTPQGWDYCVYIDYLKPAGRSTAILAHTIFKGDSIAFLEEQMQLPEVRKIRQEACAPPEWMKDVKLFLFAYKAVDYVMNDAAIETYNWYLERFGEGNIMALYEYWGGDQFNYSSDDPDAPWMKERIRAFREKSPRTKIGIYIQPSVIDENTPGAQEHPEWYYLDREGNRWMCDYPGRYVREIANEESRKYLANQIYEAVKSFDMDFMYHDGGLGFPCGAQFHRSDWGGKTVSQWYDMYLQVKEFSEAVKRNGEDKSVFYNIPNSIAGDASFQEIPPSGWHTIDWRMLSEIMYSTKFFRNGERWNSILYWDMWSPEAERGYLNYLFALGFRPCATIIHEPGSDRRKDWDMRIPYINAVYEIKDTFLVDADLSPWWRTNEAEVVDAFSLKQHDTAVISLVNHGAEETIVPVSGDTTKLGFHPGRPVFVWTLELVDRDRLTPETRTVVDVQSFAIVDEPDKRVGVETTLKRNLTKILTLSQSPGFVYSVDGFKSQMRLSDARGVKTSGSFNADDKTVELSVRSVREECQVMVLYPSGWGTPVVALDGRPSGFTEVEECGQRFLLVEVPRGERRVSVKPVGL